MLCLMVTAVEFQSVTKIYSGQEVLSNLDLHLEARATTVVVGESGSGKSTLLKLINAVVQPDSGTVFLFGKNISELDGPEHRRKIGYAVQGAGLFPHLTAHQNVTMLAKLENWPSEKIEYRYTQLAEMMNLDQSMNDNYPHQLSGGECQRFGLCRAFMLEPAMLLLDEAFSAIDPITRTSIHDQFMALRHHEPVTTLMVTHDMREAVKLGDRLVILRDGKILQSAPVNEVLDNPADAYVRHLLETQL